MDRFTRILLTHRILRAARYPVSRARLQNQLECSPASIKRIIRELRDYLGAPVEYDRDSNGYFYSEQGDHPYELPGLWFSTEELIGLVSLQALLSGMGTGLLDASLAPLRGRLEQLLRTEALGLAELPRRIRLLPMAARRPDDKVFQTVASALLRRQRLRFSYRARGSDARTARDVSPQRLANYRHNWYLDAWCHLRDGLRTFALERFEEVQVLAEPAFECAETELDGHFAAGYGLFAGSAEHLAILRFQPRAARWVGEEQWHPQQQGNWLADGRYELRLPYADPSELVMDVLRYGPDVEVVAPLELRERVRRQLEAAVAVYAAGSEYEPPVMVEPSHDG